MNWISAASKLHEESQSYVLVTVLETKGSSPRDTGTKMVVSAKQSFDTIGGGALEHKCIQIAQDLLKQHRVSTQHTQCFHLRKDLKQCCGGQVTLFFEVFPVSNFNIVIFGAGHIGQSIIMLLSELDCQVKWFDSREDIFPQNVSSHIDTQLMTKVETAVKSCNPESYFLVMTHDHAMDQEICESVLAIDKSQFCGLIGSKSKGKKFQQRLQQKGYTVPELEKLKCPVGLAELKLKKPMEIAISICAELLKQRELRELGSLNKKDESK